MGTRKLQTQGDPFPSYDAIVKEADLHWLRHAEQYANNGFINFELLAQLVNVCHWYAISKQRRIFDRSKLIFDVFIAAILILVASPILLFCALAVKLSSRGPITYHQVRIGRYGCPFEIIKFRTMAADADRLIPFVGNEMTGGMFKMGRDPRLTTIGRWLRRWSLDELPQLFNVVKGEMALVGPRPLQPEDSCTVPKEHYLRFAVRPGITGLWQVTARDSNDGRLKIKLDYDYVMMRGWKTDLKILAQTVPAVISGKGAR